VAELVQISTPRISTPVKFGATGVVLGGLAAIGYQFRRDSQVLLILLLGIICVVLLLLAYRWFLARREAARSLSMGEELKAGGRRKPREINSPQALAKIADLQGKFEEGVEKFRSAGKNLYSLPWYLLVGEPGSGKTEAVRHCNVGFPPGLQEEQQGVGGTVNMNWWFTNYAVILDTAGRLVFDGIEAGSTAEWREFLKLLHRARPNCPVNGLLLVIPADSLIVDTADQIEAKAGKIAQQLDTIQRILGVRFPVFVVVTKSDRINGFREFFDSMDDPRLQHQIMGWSNPNPLDAAFDPEEVEQHLEDVARRLGRRRLGLLLDPVHTDDPDGRRLDQVDALYAFPESLTIIGPRLRRYLERIFSVGEWSPKPLFLRGIYFTSSMREGSALDKDLADLLGVPVESLPEGRVWEQDRAYFLRDLFMTKVFREKGLVTRAGNTKQVTTRRKVAVLGSGFAAVIVLCALTVVGSRTLDRNVGTQARYWANLHDSYSAAAPAGASNNLSLLSVTPGTPMPTFAYRGGALVGFGDAKRPVRQVLADAQSQVDAPVQVPAAFFWTKLGPSFQQRERLDAYRLVFESSVLRPLIDGAREKLQTAPPLDGTDVTGAARTAGALEQLLQLEGAHANSASPAAAAAAATAGGNTPPLMLSPLFRYLLDDTQYADYTKDEASLQETYHWLFPSASQWQFQVVDAGSNASADAIKHGVDKLSDYWNVQFGDDDTAQRVTVKLLQSLRKFRDADTTLAREFGNGGGAMESAQRLNSWTDLLAQINASTQSADVSVKQINEAPSQAPIQAWSDRASLVALYRDDRVAAARNVGIQLRAVRAACPSAPTGALADAVSRLSAESNQLSSMGDPSAANASLQTELASLDAMYFKPAPPSATPRYDLIDQAYNGVGKLIQELGRAPALEGDGLAKLESGAAQVVDARKAASACGGELPPDAAPQRATCQAVAQQLGVASRVNRVMQDAVQFQSVAELGGMMRAAAGHEGAFTPPSLPMTAAANADDVQVYRPSTAQRLLAAWATLRPGSGAAGTASDAFAPQDQLVMGYAAAYVRYWDDALGAARDVQPVEWSKLAAALPTDDAALALQSTARAVEGALQPIDLATVPPETATEITQTRQRAAAAGTITADQRSAMGDLQHRWAALAGMAAPDARTALTTAGPDATARDYLVQTPAAGPYESYWQAVARAALLSLAKEPGSVADDRRERLLSGFSRFPLAPPANGVAALTPDELKQASTDLQASTSAGPADPAEFASITDPELASAYRKIKNGDASEVAAAGSGEKLKQMQALAAMLTDPDQPRCKVSTVNQAGQTAAARRAGLNLAAAGLNVTFYEETNKILNPLSSPAPAVATDKPTNVSYPLASDDAAVAQFDSGASARLAGPYPCVRALYDPAAQRAADDGSKWLVPLRIEKSGAVVFVLFTLDRPLPQLPR
jgi:hypothetical protein